MSSRSSLIASIIIVVLVFGAVGGMLLITSPYEPSRVAVVVMEPGFGDYSYADQLYRGMLEVQGDIAVQYYIPDHPSTTSEAETLLNDLASSGRYRLIVCLGYSLVGPVQKAAADFPDQRFAILDGYVPAANVVSVTFKIEQAAFLAGVLAAFLADEETSKIGILGSVESDPTVSAMVDGFIQGVKEANATYNLDVELLPALWIGSYNNSYLASQYTFELLVRDKATVIFAPVRASIMGVRDGVQNSNQSISWDPRVIAAEGDQDYLGNPDPKIAIGPSWIPVSVVPRTDLAIYNIVNATMWDEFPGGKHFVYDLSNHGVNITDFTFSTTYVKPNIRDIVWSYQQPIIDGTIVVEP